MQVGCYWHWESSRTRLLLIATLCGLSDHICCGLSNRETEECLLEHKDGSFLEFIGELKEADGGHMSNDENITEPHRVG